MLAQLHQLLQFELRDHDAAPRSLATINEAYVSLSNAPAKACGMSCTLPPTTWFRWALNAGRFPPKARGRHCEPPTRRAVNRRQSIRRRPGRRAAGSPVTSIQPAGGSDRSTDDSRDAAAGTLTEGKPRLTERQRRAGSGRDRAAKAPRPMKGIQGLVHRSADWTSKHVPAPRSVSVHEA